MPERNDNRFCKGKNKDKPKPSDSNDSNQPGQMKKGCLA